MAGQALVAGQLKQTLDTIVTNVPTASIVTSVVAAAPTAGEGGAVEMMKEKGVVELEGDLRYGVE